MRVYLPATATVLRSLLDSGVVGPAPLTAFAVTPGLRAWYGPDHRDPNTLEEPHPNTLEELEYAAMTEAARASLRLIDADSEPVARRVVIAADVDESGVTVRDDLDRGAVRLAATVPLTAIASIHVDDRDAQRVVRAAAAVVIEADLGSADAQEKVDDTEGFELAWYATQELPALLGDF